MIFYIRYYTHVGYSRQPSPNSAPTGTVPATPVLFANNKIHMPLQVIQMLNMPRPPSIPLPLATQLVIPLVEGAQFLWHDVLPHAHTNPTYSSPYQDLYTPCE